MTKCAINHEFVDAIPETLQERTLYIAMEYATAAHKCCCGCGQEVVTPLSPTDWEITYDGVSVSLSPSIGNWNFACQSHYWIEQGRVRWAAQWKPEQIAAGRVLDKRAKQGRHGPTVEARRRLTEPASPGLLSRIGRWLSKS